MDAGLFIYYIYFKVFDGQYIFFKKTPRRPPPPPNQLFVPLQKKGPVNEFQPFPNSTDCHTKHIAMLHGLWPSYYIISTN